MSTSHRALSQHAPSALVVAACEARSVVDERLAWDIRRSSRDEDGRDQTLHQTLLRRWSTLTPEQPPVSIGAQRSISSMLSAAYITAAAVDDGHILQRHQKAGQLEEALTGDRLTGPLALLAAHALLHAPEGARCHTELLDPFLPDALRTTALVEALPNLEHTSVSTLAWRSAHRFANPKQFQHPTSETISSRRPAPSLPSTTTNKTSRLLGTVAWKQAVDSTPTTSDMGGAQRYSLEYLDDTCNRMCTRRDGSASAVWVMPSLRSLTKAAISNYTDSAIPLWLGMCCMTMVARSFQAGEAGRMKTLSDVDVLNGPAKAELSQLLQSMRHSIPAPFQSYFGDDLLSAVFGVGGMLLPEHLHLRATLDAQIQETSSTDPSYRS